MRGFFALAANAEIRLQAAQIAPFPSIAKKQPAMNTHRYLRPLLSSIALGLTTCGNGLAVSSAADLISKGEVHLISTGNAEQQSPVRLQYKMVEGDVIRTRVTHLAKTLTKVDDTEADSHSRTVSTKQWRVTEVDEDGNMTFEHSVHAVDASQRVGDKDEVRYNSQEVGEAEVPKPFAGVDSQVDQVISTITINPVGEVVRRTTEDKYAMLAMGEIAIRFPAEAVSVGGRWESEREIEVRRPDKTPMRVRIREVFTLEKISAGVAYITVRNEPLTPIRHPEVEAQVMQQLNNGKLRFDIDAGRLLSKEIAWDSTVIGVAGAGSRLEYSARLDEELID